MRGNADQKNSKDGYFSRSTSDLPKRSKSPFPLNFLNKTLKHVSLPITLLTKTNDKKSRIFRTSYSRNLSRKLSSEISAR